MIKKIFDEIAAESSTNKKMEILASYKDNELLKEVLYKACSKRIKFYIKQIPEYKQSFVNYSLEQAVIKLEAFSTREITGNAAINYLKALLEGTSKDDAYIIERIIDKDPKIGMGTSNINKIFPKLIEDPPYMGAKPYDPVLIKKLFEKGKKAYSDVKMDGRYCNAIIKKHYAELESRQGEPTVFSVLPLFMKELERLGDCVLNGELTIPGISRYESNGIIASLISIGKKSKEGKSVDKEIIKFESEHNMDYYCALDSIVYTVWDTISNEEYLAAKSSTSYITRRLDLQDILSFDTNPTENKNPLQRVKLIESKMVSSFEEAMEHFQEMLNRGEEGTIVKAEDGAWKDGKPNWQCKCKLEMDVDLRITGFNYGTGKNEKVISSVNATSSDGVVNTKPTGIDEKMMLYITENQDKLLNTILEVKCSGLSQDSTGNYSLLHPVFKELRDDKNTCDSLDSIKQIQNMAKGLA